MPRTHTVSDTVFIAVEPSEVFEQVADPSQMGRWSPENRGAKVPEPGTPAPAGTTFVGKNRRGRLNWRTSCTVTASDPGRRFAFDVLAIGVKKPVLRAGIATWDYTFEAVEGGTKVTETWTDRRKGWPDPVANAVDKRLTGGHTFADFQRTNIARTLAALKADLEG